MGFCSAFTGPGPDEGPHFSQDMSHWGVHVTAVEKLLLLPPDPRVPEADFGSLGGNVFWCQRWTITWADTASGDGEAEVWEPLMRQDYCFPGR